jgi:glycosyltransferase involved in cell wall biosynthesis
LITANRQMRILILSHFYSPEPIPKPHELAVGLLERGHQVTTITAFPNYPKGQFYAGTAIRLWVREDLDGVQVIRLPLFPDHSRSVVRRCLNYGSFALSAATLGPVLCGAADVMYVEHPPLTVGLPAWVLSMLRRVPFLLRVNDLWPESVEATGMVTNQRALAWMGALERFVYRRAAAITVVSPGVRHNLLQKGVPAEKVHVIPHWADEAVYYPEVRDEAFASQHGLAGRFNILFAGHIGLAQALDVVLQAARYVTDLPVIQFVVIGDGVDAARLRREADVQGLKNVLFIGHQAAETMPKFYALAGALLVHLHRHPLFHITVPSKTAAYMACGRPILMAVEGDAADLITEAGAGVVCPSDDPLGLAAAVRRLWGMSASEREAMGAAGRQWFLQQFSRAVLLDRYEELLRALSGARGA